MRISIGKTVKFDNAPFILTAEVTGSTDPNFRICLSFDIGSVVYLSLDEAKILHQRLDLALREAYDDAAVRDE